MRFLLAATLTLGLLTACAPESPPLHLPFTEPERKPVLWSENIPVPEPAELPKLPPNEIRAAEPLEAEHPSRTVFQEYLEAFESKIQYYSYYIDDSEYGLMWVFHFNDAVKFIPVDRYFEYSRRNIVSSDIHPSPSHRDSFYDDLKYGQSRLMNYVVLDKNQSRYLGCYVDVEYARRDECQWSPTFIDCFLDRHHYNLDECYKGRSYFDNETQTIQSRRHLYENFTFRAPVGPLDLMKEYLEKTPLSVRENFTYSPTTSTQMLLVDEVIFANPNGTRTRFLMHTNQGLPIVYELLHGNDVVDRIEFDWLVFNAMAFRSRDEGFLEI